MTIRYLDPVAGNDANDGLSFANRKRTLGALTTSAVNGDDIRVIASLAPFSVGSATWTDNSSSVAFTNNANQLIETCESGWVASTNVTLNFNTFGRKTGAAHMECTIAAAFTTGKLAYKTLAAPLTLSAFQQIATFFRTNSTSSTVMDFKIALCSDTTGDTIVAEVNRVLTTSEITANLWRALMLDYGSAFPVTSINSIAIYINTDPSTSSRVFSFDHFVACKAPGAADLIDLYSLIGKNTSGEPEWYPVWGLSENGVVVGASRTSNLSTNPPRPYRGVSEAVTTYILNPLVPSPWADADGQINRNLLNITGGWDRTAMSSQTGETWLSGAYQNKGFSGTISSNYSNHVINIGFAHCTTAMNSAVVGGYNNSRQARYEFLGIVGCETPISYYTSSVGYYEIICPQIWGALNALKLSASLSVALPGYVSIDRIHGATGLAYDPPAITKHSPPTIRVKKIDNNKTGFSVDAVPYYYLSGTVFENNGTGPGTGADIVINNASPYPAVELRLDDMADIFMGDEWFRAELSSEGCVLIQSRIGGDPNLNRTVHYGRTMFESSTAVRHTASGLSWKLYAFPGGQILAHEKRAAHRFPIEYAAVQAGVEVTVSCWVYLDTLPAGNGFGIMHEQIDAMSLSLNQVDANPATLDAWQEVLLTFTPTTSGVVPIYAYGYGGGTNPIAYFDDVTVTQGAA